MSKEISHVEVYYKDSSMERISNEELVDKKFTKKQLEWIKDGCLSDLNNFKDCDAKEGKVTIENFKTFKEDDFSDMQHSMYQMLISLLDVLK